MELVRNTAYVDLSSSSIKIVKTPEEDVINFLGGRGINLLELYRQIPNPREVDPFDPKNPLIFGNGLLTGTAAPNAARFNVTALSPESKVFADANCGGFFGPAMKYAGFDRVIITGKAKNPVYLLLDDNQIEIKDATKLWGLNTQTTQDRIWDSEGDEVETACIGPAGEHLVRFACIINRVKNSASRGGLGGVMGSKNLKAVVARPTRGVKIHKPKEFMDEIIELKNYLNGSRVVQTLRKIGTPLLYEPSNLLGAIRTKNSQETQFENTLRAEEFHKYSKGAMACAACVVQCRHANAQGGEGPEYTAVGLLGANIGLSDANQVIILNNMFNELGLDISSGGTNLAWIIELSQKNLLPDEYNGTLEYGNFGLIQSLVYQTAYRQGIGDLIAESSHLVSKLGDNGEAAAKLHISSKGLPQSDPHDCRYIKAFALGLGTSSRGADHLRSRPTLEIFDLPTELTTEIYGQAVDTTPTSYNDKGVIVSVHESIYAVGDGLGICRFVTHSFNSPHLLKYGHFTNLVKQSTGVEIDDFKAIGERIINLERLFNLKLGITRADDFPPPRYMNEPATAGVAKGHVIEREKYELMLDDYYSIRGWDSQGIPSKTQKEEIEMLAEVSN